MFIGEVVNAFAGFGDAGFGDAGFGDAGFGDAGCWMLAHSRIHVSKKVSPVNSHFPIFFGAMTLD